METLKNSMLNEGIQMCRLHNYILNSPLETALELQKEGWWLSVAGDGNEDYQQIGVKELLDTLKAF